MVEHKHFNQQRAVQYYADIRNTLASKRSEEKKKHLKLVHKGGMSSNCVESLM